MLSRKQKLIVLKILSLFSVVRGYNILVIILAQYLASAFIFSPNTDVIHIVSDINVFVLVLSSSLAIASGYIINNFYDSEKDLINKPKKSIMDRLVSQNTKLSIYFILNVLSLVAASYISFRAVLFFSVYIFSIWFYSHKLKKKLFIGNIISAFLAVTPFFAIFIYYKNIELVIFFHALFLFLLVLIREFVKDLENLKGDLALNYKTIVVVYGVQYSKKVILITTLITILTGFLLTTKFNLGDMTYFFYLSEALLVAFLIIMFFSKLKSHYLILHNIIKLIIVLGVFSIALIDIKLISSLL